MSEKIISEVHDHLILKSVSGLGPNGLIVQNWATSAKHKINSSKLKRKQLSSFFAQSELLEGLELVNRIKVMYETGRS